MTVAPDNVLAAANPGGDALHRADALMAILNAVPAHVALLNSAGVILEVNEAWRRYALANVLQSEDFLVGHNYVAVCERATGACADDASDAAAGIRAVLEGRLSEFTLEYPCHSPTEDRWFRLMATPLQAGQQQGAVVIHVDITSRKSDEIALRRAERLARESEERLGFALDAARLGHWDMDLRSNVVRRSVRHDQYFGYADSVPDWSYETFLDHVHPDDRDRVDATYKAAMGGEGEFDVEYRTIWPDGTTHWLWSKGRFYFDETGAPYRVAGIQLDITSRKAAEAAIDRTVQRLTKAQRIGKIGDWEWDFSSSDISWSPEVFAIMGRDPRSGPPRGLDAQMYLYDEPSQQIIREKVALAIASGEQQDYELVVIQPDGERVNVLACAVPRIGESGTVVGLYGTVQDITERKRTELESSRLASIVEDSDDAIISKTLDGIVTSWNRGAEKIFGYAAEEIIGTPIARIIPVALLSEETAILANVGHGEGMAHFETTRVRNDGRVIDVSVTVSPIRNGNGAVVGASKVARNITERKKLEHQLLRAQRMESIGTLAGGIAHDLNNVLSPIMLSIELLRMSFLDESSHELLDTIDRSAQHGAELVRQVLSFARGVEAGRLEVRVDHLVRDIERTARDTFPKHIDVRTAVPADLWRVVGDPTQLQQVLVNLCVNARDAMPNGGTLTIAAENVSFDANYAGLNLDAKAGPYVLVRVEDSGSGMTPDVIERIFDPFFTTKEVGKGTGLGLSTSLAIVKSHGGFVRVCSEPGNGTKFTVYLPASTDSIGEQTEPAIKLPRGRGELVLVIDDEPSVRQITQQTLEAFGYSVVVAADGADAVVIYARRGQEIAVVLTDMMMPVMDGPSTIRVLRKMDPKVRIIAASGLENSAQGAGVGHGIRHFLPKPYTADALLNMLKVCLEEAT